MLWAGAAIVVGLAAFAVGSATAPQSASDSSPPALGPHELDLPRLGSAAALPELREEVVTPVVAGPEPERATTAPEESPPVVEEAPPPESADPPQESPAPTPTPPSPPPSGSEEVVPEGL